MTDRGTIIDEALKHCQKELKAAHDMIQTLRETYHAEIQKVTASSLNADVATRNAEKSLQIIQNNYAGTPAAEIAAEYFRQKELRRKLR